MRIIELGEIKKRQQAKARKAKVRKSFIIVVLIVFISTSVYITYQRPLPTISTTISNSLTLPAKSVKLHWPTYGQSAIAAEGYGILSSTKAQSPVPTASVAKVITALAVLDKKPLKSGQQGPIITLDQTDVAIYNDYSAKGGSVAAVKVGEKVTELQALEAMLLPSANNFAESLARWAFGSNSAYTLFANKFVKQNGMNNTHIDDASGFSDKTTSTAEDLVILGELALANPVIAQIVSQRSATIPVAGVVSNVNYLLGANNVIGIKTGNTNEAGGVFLLATNSQYGNKSVKFVTAIMGAPNLATAMNDSLVLAKSTYQYIVEETPVKSGQIIGEYSSSWGTSGQITANHTLSGLAWAGKTLKPKINLEEIAQDSPSGVQVGTVSVSFASGSQSTSLITNTRITKPNWLWRISHLR